MGLGAKLTFAIIAMIFVMVLASTGYSLVSNYLSVKSEGQKKIDLADSKLDDEFSQIAESQDAVTRNLSSDPAFQSAFDEKNRDNLGKAIKAFIDKIGFTGFITVIDDKGTVFYSSETPAKFGYSLRDKCTGVQTVLQQNSPWKGPAVVSPVGTVSVSSMLPVKGGIISANQPLDTQFISGFLTKLSLDPDRLSGVDMAIYSAFARKITGVDPELAGKDGGFMAKVNQSGIKAIPTNAASFESGGRLWKAHMLNQAPGNAVGFVLLGAAAPSLIPGPNLAMGILLQAGAISIAALIVGLLLSSSIGGQEESSMNFVMQRARDLAAQKTNLPPLFGLSGQWLELAETMDTAVSSMRSTVQNLKGQLSKIDTQALDKSRAQEDTSKQLENINRQLSQQTKQTTELSKQINYANQQAVFLQQKLNAVLQVSTEGFLLLDQYGNVISANAVFLGWMGVAEGEIAGRLCFDLVKKPDEGPDSQSHMQAFGKHGGNPADLINEFYPEGIIYHRPDNKTTAVLAHLQPVVSDDAHIQGWVMVLRDKSLRSEIAQLRGEIVAMLSDSIRAPLASVESTWGSILSNAAQTMHPSVGQSLAQLHSHYEQLMGLVDSLLLIYGGFVPPPAMPREHVIVTRLIADCLEETAGSARERQLMLDYKTVTGLPAIMIDRETLKSIILQLLEKMMAVTSPGGRVRVESQLKGSEMRIGISSSGPALADEEIEDMFAGFIQGKHHEDTYSTRLSMYLARNNVERLGGKIWAESEAGRGTAIFFTLAVAV